MLKFLQQRGVLSWVAGVASLLLTLVFLLESRTGALPKGEPKKVCVVEVHGRCIPPQALFAAYNLLVPRNEEGRPNTEWASSMKLLRTALDGLIERELLAQEAKRFQITVTDEELTDSLYKGLILVSIPAKKTEELAFFGMNQGKRHADFRSPTTGVFDLDLYHRLVRNITGLSPTVFREEQQQEILAEKVRDRVRERVVVGETEARELYLREKNTATVETVVFSEELAVREGKANPARVRPNASPKPVAHDPLEKARAQEESKRQAQELLQRSKQPGHTLEQELARLASPGGKDKPAPPHLETLLPFGPNGAGLFLFAGQARSQAAAFAFQAKPGALLPEVLPTENGWAVVRLHQRHVPTAAEFAKDREAYLQAHLRTKQNEALALYVARLVVKKAQVHVNEALFQTLDKQIHQQANPSEEESP